MRKELKEHLPDSLDNVDEKTRKTMRGNKRRDTKPELKVRKLLRDIGYPGYRLDWKKAPGHPDIAYPGRKIAIFVHGCFWHHCPICNFPIPKKNRDYWETKFKLNADRDKQVKTALEEQGWRVITIWEHQLKTNQIEETSRYLYEVISLDD